MKVAQVTKDDASGERRSRRSGKSKSEAPDPRARFGATVRQYRMRAGLSQFELAARTGMSQPKISNIERGATDVTFAERELIEQAFGLRQGDLLVSAGLLEAPERLPWEELQGAIRLLVRGLVEQQKVVLHLADLVGIPPEQLGVMPLLEGLREDADRAARMARAARSRQAHGTPETLGE